MSGQGSGKFWQRRQFVYSLATLPVLAVSAESVGFGGMPAAAVQADSGISLGFSLYGTKQLTLEESLRACSARRRLAAWVASTSLHNWQAQHSEWCGLWSEVLWCMASSK